MLLFSLLRDGIMQDSELLLLTTTKTTMRMMMILI